MLFYKNKMKVNVVTKFEDGSSARSAWTLKTGDFGMVLRNFSYLFKRTFSSEFEAQRVVGLNITLTRYKWDGKG